MAFRSYYCCRFSIVSFQNYSQGRTVFRVIRVAEPPIKIGKSFSSCEENSRLSIDKMRKWRQAEGDGELYLYNSLTREKNKFVPQSGRKVLWYSCGPTVYDASHMGHARSYITFDILRRVMMNYFNYDVYYVMNITDIDDKIINRARRNHLFSNYINENKASKEVLADIELALQPFNEKLKKAKDEDKLKMLGKIISNVKSKEEKLKNSLEKEEMDSENIKKELLEVAKDPISEWLDKLHGAEITDHNIFWELTRYWENEYHEDMNALNVLPCDVLTRVSQYVPEVVSYIQKIIDNGFAYESNGSVYFDTMKFASSTKHEYAKLVPEAVGDLDALAEGEGDLSQPTSGEKKSDRDFALWKASKPGEPFWDSPWGEGRPGWHIECSVMASDVLGSSIDIHTGGVDLKFPHHDNELAQAEAHYGCDQWIHYFLHAGHLTIEGCKMSKSLKNFITIKEALQKNTCRQIRFAFLLHAWNSTLDLSVNVLKEAEQTEKLFNDFFLNVKDILRKPESTSVSAHNYRQAEKDLQDKFFEKKSQIHKALCDSIDTATALQHMQSLVKLANVYIGSKKKEGVTANHSVLHGIAKYLTRLLKIFGANDGKQEIGFPVSGIGGSENQEDIVMPYISLLAKYRSEVRAIAKEEKSYKILDLCDKLRDDHLIELGVRLEDVEGSEESVVKLVGKEILLKEKQQKLEEQELKRKQKEEAKRKKAEEKAQKDAKAKMPPSEMFKHEIDKYSKFDDQGIPTHDASGKELSASQLKKLKKLYAVQEKNYSKLMAEVHNGK